MSFQTWYKRDPREIQQQGKNRNYGMLIGELENVRDAVESGFQNVWNSVGPGGGGGQVLALPEEYTSNPVLNPPIDRAYYPTVLYIPAGFDISGTPYKYVCIHSGDVDAGGGLVMAGSQDFKTWTQLNGGNPLTGLPATAHHPQLVQLGVSSFRVYYWDTTQLYSINAIRMAESTDLLTWVNDQPLQNGVSPIITGGAGAWNRGSYGPCQVIYNPTASNTGLNPYDYSYAMFFDGTTGAFESIGLGYSADGITFELYGEVLKHGSLIWGNTVPWDSGYVTFCQVFRTTLGKWLMFYSGGVTSSNDGIGVAVSNDGLSWGKLTVAAPLIGRVTGTWRGQRCYAPAVVTDFTNRFTGDGDEVDVKLLISGRDALGDYTCGYFNIPYMYADVVEALYRLGKL